MISNVAQHKSKNGVLAPYWDSALIEKSASGAVASFTDGADGMPTVSVLASIEPIQSGSGDPSPDNVRPISGWDGVNVTRCGKNILENNVTQSRTSAYTLTRNNDGSLVLSGNSSSTAIPVYNFATDSGNAAQNDQKKHIPNGTWKVPSISTNTGVRLQVLASNVAGNANTATIFNSNSGTFTIDDTYKYNRVRLWVSAGTYTDEAVYPMIIPADETDDTYEPYTAQTYTTTLPQTVYGGTIDVVSGVLTIDRAIVNMSDIAWVYDTSYTYPFFFSSSISGAKIAVELTCMCDMYKRITNKSSSNFRTHDYAYQICFSTTASGNQLQLQDPECTSVEALMTRIANGHVVYKLATPQTIQLTPQEVDSLLADNNVWADSGSVSVTYRADSTLAYEQLTTAIVSLGGNI